MSQISPEPDESTGVSDDSMPVSPLPLDVAGEATLVFNPIPASPESIGVPNEPVVIVPVTPAAAPGGPAATGGPFGSEWRQTSLAWMKKSQEITARWLYDLGGWIFGGLIVAALMLLQDLISLGFADRAALIAGLAIALALPFNLAGLGIIRYFNALNQAVEEARQTLGQSANLDAATLVKLTHDSEAFSPDKHKVMDFTVSLTLYLSILFTIIGLGSALWRISWVATLFFIVASAISLLLVLRVIRYS